MSDQISEIKRFSLVGIIVGFLLVLLGSVAIMAPFVSGVAVTLLLGGLFLVAGLIMAFFAFKAPTWKSGAFQLLFGGITIFCGISFLLKPVIGLFTLTSILLAYFCVDGVFSIIAGFRAKPLQGWGWIVFSGLISLILGGLLWYEWPLSGTFAVGILAGIRLIFSGWSIAMFGMMTKSIQKEMNIIEST